MYYTKNIIFLSSLYVILIGSLVHSIPAPSSDDNISPAREPVLFEKRWNCDSCPAKTVTDTCTVTKTEHDTCTVTKTEHDTCTVTKTEHDTCTVTKTEHDNWTITKTEHDTCTVTKTEHDTCTITKTQQNTWVITKTNIDTATVTNENTKTNTETHENTKTNTVTNEQTKTNTKTNTVTNEKTKTNTETNTVTNEKTMTNTKTNTVTDEKTKTNTVISEKTKTATDTMTLPPQTVTVTNVVTKSVTDTITKSVTDTVTKIVKTTTTVLPCNKPVPDTPCDSPMFTFVSPESGQVLKENKDFEVKYNITKLPGNQNGFVKDLQFYLVSSDLHCINQTIAQDADTAPTRVCNKSLQYTISACAKVPPAYYAIQVMYNFCNSTSGADVCVFHECKRGVVVKRGDLYMTQ